MVNGKELEDELTKIDEFFNSLSQEEFDEMLIENGINKILPSEQSSYVKAMKIT